MVADLAGPARVPERTVSQHFDVNPSSEHALFLTLFVTNSGGW